VTFLHLRDTLLHGLWLHPYQVKKDWQRYWAVLFQIQQVNDTERAALNTAIHGITKPPKAAFFRTSLVMHKTVKLFNILPRLYIAIERESLHQLLRLTELRLWPDRKPTTREAYITKEQEDPDFWWQKLARPGLVNTFKTRVPQRAFN